MGPRFRKQFPKRLALLLGQDCKNEPNEYGWRELGSRKHIFSNIGLISGKDLEEEKGGDGTYGDEELTSSPISSGEDEKRETEDDSNEETRGVVLTRKIGSGERRGT